MKTIKLNENAFIPVLGFGTWQLEGQVCQMAVEKALEVGYRHIDTATAYQNHEQIAKVLARSRIPRQKLFITSKLWCENLQPSQVREAFLKALDELQLDYLDLYLIHWPNRQVPIRETLETMAQLQNERLIRAIGVSNFTIHHLEDALKSGIKIVNNQVEFHPSLNQKELKEFCDSQGIALTAYSPIAQGQDLKLPLIQKLAKKYQRSESQVVLNWIIGKGVVAIPRAAKPKHIKDNFKTLEWQLEAGDLQLIDTLDTHNRLIKPAFADFDY